MRELADQFVQWLHQKDYEANYIMVNIDELLCKYLKQICIELNDDEMRSLDYEVRHLLQVQLLYSWKSEYLNDKKN